MTFAFAAAGTGGHVYPALAIADALVAAGTGRDQIVFFGGDRMEATTVPAAGFDFVSVDIHGLQRSLTLRNLELPLKVVRAAEVIGRELERRSTAVVTVFGGYVSVPAAWAGRRRGVTIFLHEQNAAPGLANRLITRWVDTSYIAFPAAADGLRNTRLVGNPLRPALARFDRPSLRTEAYRRYDLPEHVAVLGVLGGSLGAHVLNEITTRIVRGVDPGRVAVVHLTGPTHLGTVRARAERSAVPWRAVAFEKEMEYFYAAADLVLSRAGALTISELAATGTPAVVVPLAATNQGENAAYLAEAGAAVVVDQTDIDRVPWEVEQLLYDRERRHRMAELARQRALPGAATAVAKDLLEAAHA